MVLIPYLEFLRTKYNETKNTKYWKELVRWLPESWLQTRTVTMTYENALKNLKFENDKAILKGARDFLLKRIL